VIRHSITQKSIDDVTFTSPFFMQYSFLSDSKDSFITYVAPQDISEGLKENSSYKDTENYQKLTAILENMGDLDDANPMLIEFSFN
jgi:hypothetical protein